ncbi:MAG: S-adenosylmethionine:tRNA ribosyltransferase-isomerase [Cyclobacteriaceae bacterium]|nr:S-adenosylmethionine:tRNA ribosyltransferase-isomerase [Cyclobacteriaceae bacterium]
MEKILIKDFTYELPAERIALHALANRDQSRLLVYRNGNIEHDRFTNLTNFLPSNSTLFFNDTKVIPARLIFQKETGARIELFLLNPVAPTTLVQLAMETKGMVQWQCAIGNLKRWPDWLILTMNLAGVTLNAILIDREQRIVEFSWHPESKTFAEVITRVGSIPLPPYLNRKVEPSDSNSYQTVYSTHEGAVAAPTAGLHFTKTILEQLKTNGHATQFLTLHVSAGTFQPVKVENATDHIMHREQVVITKENLESMLSAKTVVAVGTTSLRTLESLYWYGVKLMEHPNSEFSITQHDAYTLPAHHTKEEALTQVLKKLKKDSMNHLMGETAIYIMPGYAFRMTDVLITNFHQPASTLLLLIAAFVGPDWKMIYQQALEHGYRFLSYGDSSLLFGKKE